jgi:DNA-binding transcriptional MerR regulator
VKRSGIWHTAGFASFEHYCSERLGMAASTVERRAAVEKRLWQLPALRAARDAGLSFEKVRLLLDLPEDEREAWLPQANDLSVLQLRRKLEDREEAAMRAARSLRVRVPGRVADILTAAFRAVRAVEKSPFLPDGKALVIIARHFIEVWKPQMSPKKTLSMRIRERDLGRCQAPGCSRRATHAHHVKFQSQGGGDEDWNVLSLCGCHHLICIHDGFMWLTGRAPDEAIWAVRLEWAAG